MDFSSVKRMDMSLGKVKEQAALSANSYKEHHVGEKVRINGHSYVVEKFVNNKDSGFSATLYRKENTNEHTIAYRGTDDLKDGYTDAKAYFKNLNNQNPYREKFTKEAINQISKNFGGDIEKAKANTTATGHSLGGNHAQTTGYETGINTYTYNPFGANRMIKGRDDFNKTLYDKNSKNILNISVKGDPVTPIKNQYGQNIEINPSRIKFSFDSIFMKTYPFVKEYTAHSMDEIQRALNQFPNHTMLFPFNPFNFPYIPDNDGTTKPLDPYAYPNIFPQVYDPLTLDLNNDSKISTLNLNDGVYFDHNKDGIAFKTSWIGKDDGILVFDKNNNGLIDNGNELFGNFTEISNSQTLNNPNNQTSNLNSQTKFAINGYHALSLQDSNNDGKIDTLDENFSKLKIWQDLNENGISESNELKTLKEHGIKSISLNFTKPTNSDILKDSSDIFKRQKFIQNLTKLTTSNQKITKKIYNFKSYKLYSL